MAHDSARQSLRGDQTPQILWALRPEGAAPVGDTPWVPRGPRGEAMEALPLGLPQTWLFVSLHLAGPDSNPALTTGTTLPWGL